MLRYATLLLATVSATFAACGEEGSVSTFEDDDFPFTFEYPADWEETGGVTVEQELGAQPDETLALALSDDNAIALQRFTLNAEVTQDNLDVAKEEFDGLFQTLDPSAESKATEIAGFPALSLDSLQLSSPEDGESRITILFDGNQEYLINCQSTPEEREAVEAACDAAIESIEPG